MKSIYGPTSSAETSRASRAIACNIFISLFGRGISICFGAMLPEILARWPAFIDGMPPPQRHYGFDALDAAAAFCRGRDCHYFACRRPSPAFRLSPISRAGLVIADWTASARRYRLYRNCTATDAASYTSSAISLPSITRPATKPRFPISRATAVAAQGATRYRRHYAAVDGRRHCRSPRGGSRLPFRTSRLRFRRQRPGRRGSASPFT